MRGDPARNFVAAFSYFAFFVTGLVVLMVEKEDKFIRFHATQSFYGFSLIFIVYLMIGVILGKIPFVSFIGDVVSVAILLAALVLWGFSMYKAFSGEVFKWPKVGGWAEKRIARRI